LTAFRGGLSESGFVEGRNVSIEYHWAEGQYLEVIGTAGQLAEKNKNRLIV
jgi:putative tryptophan/tyrosine transport system substrate-binding protein